MGGDLFDELASGFVTRYSRVVVRRASRWVHGVVPNGEPSPDANVGREESVGGDPVLRNADTTSFVLQNADVEGRHQEVAILVAAVLVEEHCLVRMLERYRVSKLATGFEGAVEHEGLPLGAVDLLQLSAKLRVHVDIRETEEVNDKLVHADQELDLVPRSMLAGRGVLAETVLELVRVHKEDVKFLAEASCKLLSFLRSAMLLNRGLYVRGNPLLLHGTGGRLTQVAEGPRIDVVLTFKVDGHLHDGAAMLVLARL